jgi:hypothetical protein
MSSLSSGHPPSAISQGTSGFPSSFKVDVGKFVNSLFGAFTIKGDGVEYIGKGAGKSEGSLTTSFDVGGTKGSAVGIFIDDGCVGVGKIKGECVGMAIKVG